MRYMIDPPSGWQYGFPKIWDTRQEPDVIKWLVENGYPQFKIDDLGEHFYFRSWPADDDSRGDFEPGIPTKAL